MDTASRGNMWVRTKVSAQPSPGAAFRVQFEASTRSRGQGDVAVDDVVFSPSCRLVGGGTSPAPNSTVPPTCPPETFQCSTGECIPYEKVCDFRGDCSNGEDEASCPAHFPFDNCGNITSCMWYTEAAAGASLEPKGITEIQEGGLDLGHGPGADWNDTTDGARVLFLTVQSDSGEETAIAAVFSPIYRNSDA